MTNVKLSKKEIEKNLSRGKKSMNSHRFPKYTRRPKYIPINTEEENAKVILSNLYTNRSITNLYMNNVREAVMDATQALYTSIENKNAFIARGNACVKMENFTSAYDDYIEALKLDPTSRYVFDLSSNTYQRIRQQELLDDIQTKTRSILDYPYFPYQPISPKTFDFQNFTVDDAIEVMNIVERFELLSPEITLEMMATMCEIMAPLPNVVNIPDVNEIFVVGDTHGQLQDVLNIFKKFGNPSAKRPYLFNGDYVDRGSQGLEILLILFAWKIADDKCIYINRGNQYVLLEITQITSSFFPLHLRHLNLFHSFCCMIFHLIGFLMHFIEIKGLKSKHLRNMVNYQQSSQSPNQYFKKYSSF
ncbi:hypothetical protein TRFO_02607 [Tritrichomonas foetus]|uniref:Serine/threonine specific protein phosphatases domain-containing protein n=1 Tax=Tritrichomonas foetus TaxID=1144522 RepID=A0A1J4L2A6_9EUKA|nr:hypothetical protein TRFO_02607 [Tritrichomonas foetus]|eukprot:OHT17546.1 hypothetical protein TRFO_02607 [Tritrichomonas foetus]